VFQTIRAPMARRRVATTIFGTDNRRAFQDSGQRADLAGGFPSRRHRRSRAIRSCTRPTCSLGSRVGRCSASGTGTWVHARSRSNPGS
jgi:hypothetical protein